MARRRRVRRALALSVFLLAVVAARAPRPALAFSQSSPITPLGHEWLTAASALDLLGEPYSIVAGDAGLPALQGLADVLDAEAPPEDPGEGQQITDAQAAMLRDPQGKLGLQTFGAKYFSVWSAVMGQRWVDIGGFSIVRPRGKVCWDSITQSQAHVQYSHFLRQADDVGGKGALKALRAVRLRFKLAFLAAATAKATPIDFWDGGAASVRRTALRPFFLLGRAAHLLQDSFSTEHGIRDASDGFRTVLGIKSYLCTQDSAQHTHRPPVKNDHGDVIWLDPSAMDVATDFGAGNVKPEAAAARDAMRDMWAGFLRARSVKSSGRSKAAQREADAIIKKWFSFDDAAVLANGGAEQNGGTVEQAFSGAERDQCLSGIAPAEEVETARKDCVRRVGGGTLGGANGFDDDLQIPFDWAIPIREGLKEDAKELGKGIKGAAGKAGGKAKAALEGAGKKVKGALESAGNSIKGAFGKVKGLFGGGGRMRW